MERSSQSAARFIQQLSQLAERLAARDIVVMSLHAEYSFFGSWQLVVEKRHEAVRFFWDGRDGYITVEGSLIHNHSAPNEWKQEAVNGFDRPFGDRPHRYVEEYLLKRFPV